MKKGFNYVWPNSGFNTNTVYNDLVTMKAAGVESIRPTIPHITALSIGDLRKVCVAAHNLSEHVSWGVTQQSGQLTSSNLSAFDDACFTQLQWMHDTLIDNFTFEWGNELENNHDGSLTNTDIRAHIRSLSTQAVNLGLIDKDTIYQSYGSGITGYATYQQAIDLWASEGVGALRIGFHIYDTLANFKSQVASAIANFGENWVLSEWADQQGFSSYSPPITEAQWTTNTAIRLDYLNGVMGNQRAMFWDYQADNTSLAFPLKPSTGFYRDAWNIFKGPRKTFIVY